MAERTNAAVLKTAVGQPTGGSNPSPPATLVPIPFRSIAITPPSLSSMEQFEKWLFGAKEKGADAFLLRKIPVSLLDPILMEYGESFFLILHASYRRDWDILHFHLDSLAYLTSLKGRLRGYSAHSLSELIRYQDVFDYFFLSPIFPTESHPEVTPLGLSLLQEAVRISSKPIFALGGITNDTYVELCREIGVYGFASIRYFLKD